MEYPQVKLAAVFTYITADSNKTKKKKKETDGTKAYILSLVVESLFTLMKPDTTDSCHEC